MVAGYLAMLVLSGPPGVGKTTIGLLCAQRLGIPFVDSDQAIAKEAGSSVAELLEREGEAALRTREHKLIAALGNEPCVLAVGGGLITVDKTRRLLKQSALLIGLEASVAVLCSRLAHSGMLRPLLQPDPQSALPRLLAERESAYRDVHVRLSIDTLSATQVAETICPLYRQLFPQLHIQTNRNHDCQRQMFGDSEVYFTDELPDPSSLGTECLLIHDQILETVGNGVVREWLSQFPVRYSVPAGEPLKDLAAFPHHVEQLLELAAPLTASRLSVVAVGGGSVGDFAGFFASVFKRGVSLIQIPSTWLAAIDSAHGGKNALNIGKMKNQIGTIAFARRIFLSRSLLAIQPKERAQKALGELAKIAIIDGNDWTTEPLAPGADSLWRVLPYAVAAKYRVVLSDPHERLGERQKLNLGHTVGHVLETIHRLPHGLAVAQGLHFALHFSWKKGILGASDLQQMIDMLTTRYGLTDRKHELPLIPQAQFVQLLTQDKKRASQSSVRFVLVRGRGDVITTEVTLSELVAEAARQQYIATV